MFKVFEKAFLNLKSVEDARIFLNDLLTRTEKTMIAKRLAIAVLLTKGYDYRSISSTLKVSATTINAILKQQTIDGRGYKNIVGKILRDEDLESFYLKLTRHLGKIIGPHPVNQRRIESEYQRKENRRQRSAI